MSGRTWFVATSVVLACLPVSVRADVTKGNDLWSYCTEKGGLLTGLCGGYVMAISEAMATGLTDGVYGYHACIPAQVTRGQTLDVVKRYLERLPEQRHLPAVILVARALQEAFPCKP